MNHHSNRVHPLLGLISGRLLVAAGLVLSAGLASSTVAREPGACCSAAQACESNQATDMGMPPWGFKAHEERANTFTSSLQGRSCLAVDPKTGTTLVVWESRRQEAMTFGVVAQTFDPLGRLVGTEMRVNEFLPGAQHEPAIAMAPDGTAWITWQSDHQDGNGGGVYLRRFVRGKSGAYEPAGAEMLVNTTTQGEQADPSVAINSNGQALVVWTSQDGKQAAKAMGRLFQADGQPVADEFALSAEENTTHRFVTAAATKENRFVVAWDTIDENDEPGGIRARFVNAEGSIDGDPFIISGAIDPSSPKWSIEPAMDVDAEGNMVFAWLRTSDDGAGYDVVTRRFTCCGGALGEPTVVSRFDGDWQSGASVAVADDGRFVVAYNVFGEKERDLDHDAESQAGEEEEESGSPAAIMAQRFDAQGNPLGKPFRVNQHEKGVHTLAASSNSSRVAWGPQDQLAMTWDGATEGDSSGIALTVLAPADLEIEAPAAVARVASSADLTKGDVVPPEWNPDYVPTERDPNVQGVGPDFGFQAWTTTEWQPPDPDLAVGPNHVICVVNMRIKIFEKSGLELSEQYLEDFWGDLGANYFVFDPVAQYDPHADRFVVVAAEHEGGNSSRSQIDIAVSKTSDPTQGWNKYRFSVSNIGTFLDFENLGIGTDAYYISADYFGGQGNVIHILEKAPMLVGDPLTLDWVNTNPNIISLGSTDTWDDNAPAQYFMSAFFGSNVIHLMAITNPLTNPTLYERNITVTPFASPPGASQKGSSNLISTVDERTKHGVYRNGSLYIGHAIGENRTARVRWYEIRMNGWPTSGQNPTLVQESTINLGSGQHSWFQDIGVDAEGDMVIVANRSSVNDYPFVSRFIRKAGDPPNTLRSEVRLIESNGAHTGGRWGDYAGVDNDPAEPDVFWSHHEYNEGTGTNWRTWVGRVDTDRSMVLEVPTLIRGTRVDVALTGASDGGLTYLAYSLRGEGSTYIKALDVTMGIRQPKLGASARADANGAATFNVKVPAGAPQTDVWLQAAEANNTSNVVKSNIQ